MLCHGTVAIKLNALLAAQHTMLACSQTKVWQNTKEAVCLRQEFSRHDEQPSKYIKTYNGHNPRTGQEFSCKVAYERFLGPELFFNPEIYSSDYTTPLPQVTHPPLLCYLKADGTALPATSCTLATAPVQACVQQLTIVKAAVQNSSDMLGRKSESGDGVQYCTLLCRTACCHASASFGSLACLSHIQMSCMLLSCSCGLAQTLTSCFLR